MRTPWVNCEDSLIGYYLKCFEVICLCQLKLWTDAHCIFKRVVM